MKRRSFLSTAAGVAGVLAAGRAAKSSAAQLRPPLKLRYAIPTSFFSAGDRPLLERLEFIAAMGFKAVEFNGMKSLDTKELEAYGAKLEDLGLDQGVWVTNTRDHGPSGLVNPEEREAFLKDVRNSVEIAPIVRGRYSTVTTGNMVRRISRSRAKLNTIEALKRAADIVENSEVTLVVEPLNTVVDHYGYYLARSDEAYEIMKAVDHPRVKILFDIYHQQITEGNLIRNIRATYDETAYYQFADNPGRKEPYTGEINYEQVFKAIYDLGFTGIIGAEMGQSKPGDEGSYAALEAIYRADRFKT